MKHLLSDFAWDDIDIDDVVEHSYKDFHTKGMDYLCLSRSPELTLKAYFFAEGMDSQEVGEVINPHNHRYDFRTQCFSGTIENQWYRPPPCWDGESIGDECGPMYDVYEWRTPLLGSWPVATGETRVGFEYIDRIPLQRYRIRQCPAGSSYYMYADQLHTIRVVDPETCIVLQQYEDVVPASEPTHTFTQARQPPDISELYSGFTADQAVKRLALLREMADRL